MEQNGFFCLKIRKMLHSKAFRYKACRITSSISPIVSFKFFKRDFVTVRHSDDMSLRELNILLERLTKDKKKIRKINSWQG